MWLKTARMVKHFDGSGVVKIQCSADTYDAMKLDDMPTPDDWGEVIDGQRVFFMDTRGMGADSERYRVVWPEHSNGEGSKFRSSSFTLSSAHSNETLFVLAEWLRSQSVNFVALANKHGNTFKSVGLSGSSLAYLTGDIPKPFSPNVDLLHEPLPIDV